MKQHKWHKEIKAWADGATIEGRDVATGEWVEVDPLWVTGDEYEYRIKPQPKEPDFDATEYQKALKKSAQKFKEKIERTYAEAFDKAINELAQPKEPQYLKVYGWLENENITFYKTCGRPYLGKIKLENDDADQA
jgi:hypothetical protein